VTNGAEAQGEGVGGRVVAGLQGAGQVGEGRGGPGVGARVGGDADRRVGGDHGPVEGGGAGRVEGPAEQHRGQGVDEQRPAGQRVGSGGEVERVEPHPGRAEVQVGAADRVGEAAVLVFGVDDEDLHPAVEGAQRFQLGQVALAGAGAGEDDRVVVVAGEAVPAEHARAGCRDAVQHTVTRAQVDAGEREGGGERGGVHRAAQAECVDADRQGGDPALQGAESGWGDVEQQRGDQGPHPGALGLQRVGVGGVHGEVEPEAEQLAFAAGEASGEVAGVGGGDVGLGVGEASLGGVEAPGRLQPGELAAQPVRRDLVGHRVDVQGDVDPPRVGEERGQPAEADLAGVAGDGEAAADAVAETEPSGPDLDGVRYEQARCVLGATSRAGRARGTSG